MKICICVLWLALWTSYNFGTLLFTWFRRSYLKLPKIYTLLFKNTGVHIGWDICTWSFLESRPETAKYVLSGVLVLSTCSTAEFGLPACQLYSHATHLRRTIVPLLLFPRYCTNIYATISISSGCVCKIILLLQTYVWVQYLGHAGGHSIYWNSIYWNRVIDSNIWSLFHKT